MLVDDGVRLPGARREALLARARADGLNIDDTLLGPCRPPSPSFSLFRGQPVS
jgi:hypothetical protein